MADATLCLLLGWASACDILWRRIPNRCTAAGCLGFAAVSLVAGDGPVGRLAWGLGLFASLGIVAALRPGALGMGDAKLAALVGLALGPDAAVALAAGLASALAWAALRSLPRGAGTLRGTTVALAPHLAFGAALAAGLVG